MNEQEIRSHLKTFPDTKPLLIKATPLSFDVLLTRFGVAFRVREHRIRRTFQQHEFRFDEMTETYRTNIRISTPNVPVREITLYWTIRRSRTLE